MIRLFLVIILISSCLGCQKKSASDGSKPTGKWRASAFGYDTGSGDPHWEPEHVNKPPYIIFPASGPGVLFDGNDSATAIRYEIIDGSTMVLERADGVRVSLQYSFSPSLLTITGGCIEFCGTRYVPEAQ